jgi:hypothetical protein
VVRDLPGEEWLEDARQRVAFDLSTILGSELVLLLRLILLFVSPDA